MQVVEKLLNKQLAQTITAYANQSRLRSLIFNLKKNPELVSGLLSGKLDPIYFASKMSHCEMSLNPPVQQKIIQKEYPDGLIKCDNCGSLKTECSEFHNIEYTTIFIYCNECGQTTKT